MIFPEYKSLCKLRQKIIISEERGKKHIACNKDSNCVYQYHVDGEIIKDGRKCDYLLENAIKNAIKQEIYLIELKGNNLDKAISQLESTYNFLQENDLLNGYKVKMRVVYKSNTHAVHGIKVNRFKKKFQEVKIAGTVIKEDI